jgi:predicted ATPase
VKSNNIYVDGFKCFKEATFKLKNLTVFAGSNGTGKSSLIQALLLIRLALEKNGQIVSNNSNESALWKNASVPLNSGYELALGTIDDIFNKNDSAIDRIVVKIDDEVFEIPLFAESKDPTSAKIFRVGSFSHNSSFLYQQEFYYLNAERLGPKHTLPKNSTEFLHCGWKGEFTAQVLLENDFFKIDKPRLFPKVKSTNLSQQVDAWLGYICPGTSVTVEPLGTMSARIRLRNDATKSNISATNIGFGISYVLPVIINGLVAKKESVLIVENPEAHLHPKGQSNIGFFLGVVAASGVKVIIETHSEHVINGLKRVILIKDGLPPEDAMIYFFDQIKGRSHTTQEITIDSQGNLKPFPRDFFDQVQQDNAEIFRMIKSNSNG